MAVPHFRPIQATRLEHLARVAVGLVWIAGAVFNAAVTTRMANPFGWLTESPVPLWRWFFDDVVTARPVPWTLLLATFELAIGLLTLGGSRARTGLIGGAAFSAFLFSLATPYTLVMGPYTALLVWLARKEYRSMAGRFRHRAAPI
jgi:hypothetical protein